MARAVVKGGEARELGAVGAQGVRGTSGVLELGEIGVSELGDAPIGGLVW
ncbi:MAG: hypothetical protein LC777_11285 [Actinobacteria bacterium]|nr:hypothetical protein [Actinomycetota bacterium]